jgi:hypothetical protein
VDVSPDSDIGPVSFRLLTPLGTSPEGRLLIEPYYGESPDREPNDSTDTAFETYLPSILVGAISRPGDIDHYKITVTAGEQLVFENAANMVGSTLQPVVAIIDEKQAVLQEFGVDGGAETSYFAYRFEKAGTHFVQVRDYQRGGRASHFYRIKVGRLPLAISAYPLGVPAGTSKQVALRGYNLGEGVVSVEGKPSPEDERAVIFRAQTPSGHSFNRVKLSLGTLPELESNGTNYGPETAQSVTAAATVNGKIQAGKQHYFRFKAQKDREYVIDVEARRLGSEFDSFLEILDAKGNPVERDRY